MKPFYYLLLITTCFSAQSYSIENDANENWNFSLGAYLVYEQVRDETLNRLRNHGPGIAFQTEIARQTPTNEHLLSFELPLAVLLDSYDFVSFSLHYGLTGIGLWNTHPELSIGYFAGANVRTHYFPDWDDSHLYWVTDYSIGPAIKIRKAEFPEFDLLFYTSILSLVSRSPQHPLTKMDKIVTLSGIFSTPQKNLHGQNLFDYQTGALRLRYLPRKNKQRIWEYRLEYVHVVDPLDFAEVRHIVSWQHVF